MSGDNILLRETSNGVATITLNRPNQYNALSAELLDALIAELEQIAADESVRLVILAAEGKAFCAGLDLGEHISHIQAIDLLARLQRVAGKLGDGG